MNICMTLLRSCSGCCGLHNVRMTRVEKQQWLGDNTDRFLGTDISRSENIVAFRKMGEEQIRDRVINPQLYVCPFLGYTHGGVRSARATDGALGADHTHGGVGSLPATDGALSGCLLHPQGSPHPQIRLWQHPQNFSFYGESICQSYDCLAKDRSIHHPDFFIWAAGQDSAAYGRFLGDYNLHRAIQGLPLDQAERFALYSRIDAVFEKNGEVVTSFESIEPMIFNTPQACEEYIEARLSP